MKRFMCTISYDGTQFFGYQVQPNKRTVQAELEKVLTKLHKGQSVKVVASGRTDTGVHAKGQIIHFDSDLTLPPDRWLKALNATLPDDIRVYNVTEVAKDFHARYDVQKKEYRYYVECGKVKDPFNRFFTYHYPYKLELQEIKKAIPYFLGTHDFTSFCSAKTEVIDKVRTIHKLELVEEDEVLIFKIEGNGFLYNMVRIIIGTLLEVGSGKRTAQSIKEIIDCKDRTKSGKTAPSQGLYLWKVTY